MKPRITAASLLLASILLGAAAAQAESTEGKFIPKSADGVDDGKGTGWHPFLKGAANFSLGQSSNTPGNPDGVSLQFGYLINGAVDYLSPKKNHEWTNSLGLELQYAKTPVVDTLIKSADKIDFRSAYFFHPTKLPQIGPFVSFRLTAPMLPADAVYADPQNVIHLNAGQDQLFDDNGNLVDEAGDIIDVDHEDVTQYKSAARIPLTDAFAPLILRESVGIFAIPVDKPTVKFDARLGFGAWETFVRDGYIVDDNEDTADFLELRRMEDSVQVGPELGAAVSGTLKDIFSYRASALFMQPIYPSSERDLSGIDLLNMEFEVNLGVKLTKYLSIDYAFKAYRQPLIVEDWQIQNNLLISVGFAVPEPPPPPPACPEPAPCPTCPEKDEPAPAADTAPGVDAAPAAAPERAEASTEPEATEATATEATETAPTTETESSPADATPAETP